MAFGGSGYCSATTCLVILFQPGAISCHACADHCDSSADFWSYLSVFLSSLVILCPTNSSHLSPLSSDFYDLISTRPIFSAREPFLGSWSKICLPTESWENHGVCLVNILFMWITSMGCLFPMSENNSFLYYKQFSSCLWSERMSRTGYSHSEKQNLELLFKNLQLNRNKIKIKWKMSGYNWKNSSSKYHLIVLWMILWKIKYTMICSALPASLQFSSEWHALLTGRKDSTVLLPL